MQSEAVNIRKADSTLTPKKSRKCKQWSTYTTQKTKDWEIRILLETKVNSGAPKWYVVLPQLEAPFG
jgi:hypothetical protein